MKKPNLRLLGDLTPAASATPLYLKYVGIQFAAGYRPSDLLTTLEGVAGPNDGQVVIPMPCCGQQIRYPSINDIPTETTPCPCGADWAWVVKYEEA